MTARERIDSIDLLRGVVIVLMGLDHVRNFFGPTPFAPEDLTQASAALFLTRWVTHFCAPVFVFLAGLGAGLYRLRGNRSRAETARFLWTRGLFLIALELTVINASWLSYWSGYMFIQVIWVIGASMIALAGLLYLPRFAILVFSLAMIVGHNLFDPIEPGALGEIGWLWGVLHEQHWIPLSNGFGMLVIYPLVPWIAVMSLGYLFAPLYQLSASERRRRLLTWGAVLTALFVATRALNLYGDPSPWEVSERGGLFTALSFLNATKYPASLDFLLMTLGPALLALPYLEQLRGRLARTLIVFGRVPLFFYVIHLPFIHALALIYSKVTYGIIGPEAGVSWIGWFLQGPQAAPPGYEQNLWLIWGVWIAVSVALYWPCKWYAALKRTSDRPIFKYL